MSCVLTCSTTLLAQTPSEICIPTGQALIIGNSLRKGELLKSAYKAERKKSADLQTLVNTQQAGLTARDSTIAFHVRTIAVQDTVLADSKKKVVIATAKARRNGTRAILAGTVALILLVLSVVR